MILAYLKVQLHLSLPNMAWPITEGQLKIVRRPSQIAK